MPPGLKLAASGRITGKPTAVVTSTFVVSVRDSAKPRATATAQLSITVDPMTVATTTLPDGAVGTAYKQKLAANGGKGAHHWSVVAGALPPGTKLAPSGTITGHPSAAGDYQFTVQVADTSHPAFTATADLSIHVS